MQDRLTFVQQSLRPCVAVSIVLGRLSNFLDVEASGRLGSPFNPLDLGSQHSKGKLDNFLDAGVLARLGLSIQPLGLDR